VYTRLPPFALRISTPAQKRHRKPRSSFGHPFFTDGDLELDGRSSFHEWARPMTRYEWTYLTGTGSYPLARGITARVPRRIWNQLRAFSGVMCLHIYDADLRTDVRCWGPNSALPPPIDNITPNMRQQVSALGPGFRFHRILETSGLGPTMDGWTGFTVLVPQDTSLTQQTFDTLMSGPQSARQTFVLDHVVLTGALTRSSIQGAASVTLASGRTLAISPQELANRIVLEDHPTTGNAILHVVNGRVPVL